MAGRREASSGSHKTSGALQLHRARTRLHVGGPKGVLSQSPGFRLWRRSWGQNRGVRVGSGRARLPATEHGQKQTADTEQGLMTEFGENEARQPTGIIFTCEPNSSNSALRAQVGGTAGVGFPRENAGRRI